MTRILRLMETPPLILDVLKNLLCERFEKNAKKCNLMDEF